MVSKIDNTPSAPLRRSDTARADAVAKNAAASARGPRPEPESRPASAASGSLLARATDIARKAPEIDQERVDNIKAAIARGEFRIDPAATARAFIDMESSLLPGE